MCASASRIASGVRSGGNCAGAAVLAACVLGGADGDAAQVQFVAPANTSNATAIRAAPRHMDAYRLLDIARLP
ncbi:MAG TPA: hypothetical protein VGR63_16755 [Casimicrobiaceae bacterium]|nr:hypothetical protein [Casimicrobiaceae bacterium]